MPGDSATAKGTLEKIIEPYDSAEEMTSGQLKQLGIRALELLPFDMPKGFAQKLIDSDLKKIIAAGLEYHRREWRLLHSSLQEVGAVMIPATSATTVGEYLSSKLSKHTHIDYRLSRASLYSVWGDRCQATPLDEAMVCRAMRRVERARLIEAFGGKLTLENSKLFARFCLTPVQALAILDADKGELSEDCYFLIGKTHENNPLFLYAWRLDPYPERPNQWGYNERWLSQDDHGINEGNAVIFARSLFSPL